MGLKMFYCIKFASPIEFFYLHISIHMYFYCYHFYGFKRF